MKSLTFIILSKMTILANKIWKIEHKRRSLWGFYNLQLCQMSRRWSDAESWLSTLLAWKIRWRFLYNAFLCPGGSICWLFESIWENGPSSIWWVDLKLSLSKTMHLYGVQGKIRIKKYNAWYNVKLTKDNPQSVYGCG